MSFITHEAGKLQQWLVETAGRKTADQEQANGGEQPPSLMNGTKTCCLATGANNVHWSSRKHP